MSDITINEEALKEAASKEEELRVWNAWKQDKGPHTLKPVLEVLKPTIDMNANKLTGNLPKSAVRAKMVNLTVQYLEGYDPNKSKLNTYIENTAGQKLHRYIYEHQNLGTVPEPRISKVGNYNRVKSNLKDQLGRNPTHAELADELRWPVKQVELMEKEMRKDLVQDAAYVNISEDQRSDIDEDIMMLHAELHGQDKQVLEYLYGLEGKEVLSNAEIARKLNISNSMVTQIKNKLAQRLRSSGMLTGY